MTEHRITSEFFSIAVLDIQIGDYITHGSENYYINRLPGVVKLNNSTYQYKIDFESVMYDLAKKLFISIDGLAEYGRTGTAADFVSDIVNNLNDPDFGSGWSAGTVDVTGGEKTLVFSNESCRSALTRVAEAFSLEYSLTGKSISLVKSVGAVTILSFEYGKNNGLYKLERQQVSDQNIITKVYGFGSTTNIPFTYRDRAKRLIFDTTPPTGFGGGNRFLTKNTDLYGTIEGQYTNNDIYPNRTGTLTAVKQDVFSGDKYSALENYVEDSSIDFDIGTSRIEGAAGAPSIVFKSGDLAGQEFEIWKYDNTLKRIYFNPQTDEDGYTTPNPLNLAAISNTYTLVNIALPQSYIDTAEAKLLDETAAYLDENCVPMVVYTVEIDPKWAKTNELVLSAGDRVTVVDSALGVNNLIRIAAIEYPLTNTYKIKATIADFVPYTQEERVIINTISTQKETNYVDRTSDELTRRHTMRMQQLRDLIFDADGYFDGTRIKPLSVETLYLSVGVTSTNFHLNGVKIMPNYLGDPNAIYISAGSLVHHVWKIGEGYEWIIGSSAIYEDLDPETPYYLYAKISKTSLTGQWDLSPDKKATDGNDGYYYLVCGILYAVYTDAIGSWRDFDFTYGMTYINGRIITTGRIQTTNQLNYIDLDTNQVRIGDSNSGIDWNVTTPNVFTILGGLIQRTPSGAAYPISIYRGAYDSGTIYYKGDYITYLGSTWNYINDTPGSGHTPEEGVYWTQLASATPGADGADGTSPVGIFRGEWNEDTDYYGTANRVDIVYYSTTQLYYIAKPVAGNPFRGQVPTDTTYWDSFGANFESVATNLLFANLAHIDNLGVRYFEGVPVLPGDLSGTVDNTQAASAGTNKIVSFTLSGSSGQGNITIRGITRTAVFSSTLEYTASSFVSRWYYWYLSAGITLSSVSNVIYAEATDSEDITDAAYSQLSTNLTASIATSQAYSSGQKRIDTVTLTGTGGSANIKCNVIYKTAQWAGSLGATAYAFAQAYASAFLAIGVVVTASGDDVVFTSQNKGYDFSGPTLIATADTTYVGAVSIVGNNIWEDKTNNGTSGAILVNMKGYLGGTSYARQIVIGDGRGAGVIRAGGKQSSGNKFVDIFAQELSMFYLPTTNTGLAAGRVWVDANGYLKIVQ